MSDGTGTDGRRGRDEPSRATVGAAMMVLAPAVAWIFGGELAIFVFAVVDLK